MLCLKRNNHVKIAAHIFFWLASIAIMLLFFYKNENRVHFDLFLSYPYLCGINFVSEIC